MNHKNNDLALFTDLYELTMAAVYFRRNMFSPATFSLFIREYPRDRGYFVSAGLEEVLDYLESFHFNDQDMAYLESTGLFRQDFLDYLRKLRFTGEVHAIPEGSVFFRDEPILEVTAPIIEAQVVETFVINAANLQTTIASKAARCLYAAKGRSLIDFSLRRTQGTDAGLKAARASYIAGFEGTSNVLAGRLFHIPTSGTMAHSFVTSFENEIEAFRAFAEAFPDSTILLIDTYDTLAGAKKAVKVAREMEKRGKKLIGVRLDSGDMAELSREVRKVFNEAGLNDIRIFASGSFDEFKIEDVLKRGADIDGFGVGTKMGVSADMPFTDMAYKLVEYKGRPILKLSEGKRTLVLPKQVYRGTQDNRLAGDVIALREERVEGTPLLQQVMKGGRKAGTGPGLDKIRERFLREFGMLESAYKRIRRPATFPVSLGPELERVQEKITSEMMKKR